jgi:hypothetical protein
VGGRRRVVAPAGPIPPAEPSDAFRMDPELVEFSRTDAELLSVHGDIDDLVG